MIASPQDDAPNAEVPKIASSSDLRLSDEPEFHPGGFGLVIAWAFIACLLTLINRFAGHFVPIPQYGTMTGHLLALVYFAALLFTLLMLTREAARLPWKSGALLGIGLAFAVPMGVSLLMQNLNIRSPFLSSFLTLTANNLFLPVAAALIGAAIGRIIKHPNTLLAGAGFAIFFDFVVVTMGTVAQLMKTNSNIINIVSLGGGNTSAVRIAELPSWMRQKAVDPITGVTIGPADVLFLALFQAAVYHQRLSPRATFWWMFALLMLALALVEVTGLPVPALIPMGVAVLIANAKHAAFTKTERRDLVIGGIFAVFCAAVIVYVSQRAITQTPPAATLGFTIGPVSANEFYVEPSGGDPKQLEKGSLGEKAGLIGGDQILRVNGIPTGGLFGNDQLYGVLGDAPKKGLTLRVRLRDTPTVLDVYLPPSRPLTPEEQQKFGKLPRAVRPK